MILSIQTNAGERKNIMEQILEKLWDEYLFLECAEMETEKEREFTRKAGKQREKVNSLLNKEQQEALEKYVDAIYDMESLFIKKAFFKGCEFTLSFLIGAGRSGK